MTGRPASELGADEVTIDLEIVASALDRQIHTEVMKRDASWCQQFKAGHCDGSWQTHCGACGGSGHGNCYGNGQGRVFIPCCRNVPPYSTDIGAAWTIISHMQQHGYVVRLESPPGMLSVVPVSQRWVCSIWKRQPRVGHFAGAAPLAICRAALAAVAAQQPAEAGPGEGE